MENVKKFNLESELKTIKEQTHTKLYIYVYLSIQLTRILWGPNRM